MGAELQNKMDHERTTLALADGFLGNCYAFALFLDVFDFPIIKVNENIILIIQMFIINDDKSTWKLDHRYILWFGFRHLHWILSQKLPQWSASTGKLSIYLSTPGAHAHISPWRGCGLTNL